MKEQSTLTCQTKLFISLSYTVLALSKGWVTTDDLNSGLFYFGCDRPHCYKPGFDGAYVDDIISENLDIHSTLVSAVEQAEKDGRVRWRQENESSSFDVLNELLTANGYRPLQSPDAWAGSYNHREVKELSTQLFVVWALA